MHSNNLVFAAAGDALIAWGLGLVLVYRGVIRKMTDRSWRDIPTRRRAAVAARILLGLGSLFWGIFESGSWSAIELMAFFAISVLGAYWLWHVAVANQRPAPTVMDEDSDPETAPSENVVENPVPAPVLGHTVGQGLLSADSLLPRLDADDDMMALVKIFRFRATHLAITKQFILVFNMYTVQQLGPKIQVHAAEIAGLHLWQSLGGVVQVELTLRNGEHMKLGGIQEEDIIVAFKLITKITSESTPAAQCTWRFNAPPWWEVPKEDWVPEVDWRPDPSWRKCPPGWQFCEPVPSKHQGTDQDPFERVPGGGIIRRVAGSSLIYLGILTAVCCVPLGRHLLHTKLSGVPLLGEMLGIWFWGLGRKIDRSGRQYMSPILKPGLLPAEGSFVLYLRSFDDDIKFREMDAVGHSTYTGWLASSVPEFIQSGLTQEEQLVAALQAIGPVIALGKPGEVLPEAGAIRTYRPIDDWQEYILEMISQARLVFLVLGSGDGLLWELEQAIKNVAPKRLIIAVGMPPHRYTHLKRTMARRLEDVALPSYPGGAAAPPGAIGDNRYWVITFNDDWRAHITILEPINFQMFKKFYRSFEQVAARVAGRLSEDEQGPSNASRKAGSAGKSLGPVIMGLLCGFLIFLIPMLSYPAAFLAIASVFTIGITATVISIVRTVNRNANMASMIMRHRKDHQVLFSQ